MKGREVLLGGAREPDNDGVGDAAWGIVGYLGAGLLVYGGLGWLIGSLTGHVSLCVMIGLILGTVLSTTMVFLRYNRIAATGPVKPRRARTTVSSGGTTPGEGRRPGAVGPDL